MAVVRDGFLEASHVTQDSAKVVVRVCKLGFESNGFAKVLHGSVELSKLCQYTAQFRVDLRQVTVER